MCPSAGGSSEKAWRARAPKWSARRSWCRCPPVNAPQTCLAVHTACGMIYTQPPSVGARTEGISPLARRLPVLTAAMAMVMPCVPAEGWTQRPKLRPAGAKRPVHRQLHPPAPPDSIGVRCSQRCACAGALSAPPQRAPGQTLPTGPPPAALFLTVGEPFWLSHSPLPYPRPQDVRHEKAAVRGSGRKPRPAPARPPNRVAPAPHSECIYLVPCSPGRRVD